MAKRKRADYVPPTVRPRAPRPRPERPAAAPAAPGSLRRVLLGAVLGALAVAVVVGWYLLDRAGDRALQQDLTAGDCRTDTRSDPLSGVGEHVDDPVFDVDPPAGGRHTPQVAKAGSFRGNAVPEDGPLVHALEHGYVVLWHRPTLPEGDVARLRRVADEHEGDVIVAERASMGVPVAATAWGQRLLCSSVEPAALERFVGAHVGEGPEDVDRG